MKKIIALLALLILSNQLCFANNDSAIVAIVGDKVITAQDLENRTDLLMLTAGMDQLDDEAIKALKKQVLEILIDEKIVAIDAGKLGLTVDEHDLHYALEQVAAKNNLSINEFLKAFADSGGNIEEYKKQLSGQFLWQKLIRYKLEPFVSVSGTEIKEGIKLFKIPTTASKEPNRYMNLSEIVIFKNKDSSNTENFVKQVTDQLAQKADFESVAKEFSQSMSAANGGAIGEISVSQLPPEVQKAFKKAKKGTIVGPIKTSNAYYIFKIHSIKNSNTEANEELENKVEQFIKEKKMTVKIRSYIRQLRRQTFVEIKDSSNRS